LIDSDVLIDVQRLRPEAVAWLATLSNRQTVSGATALELLFGSRDTARLESSISRRWMYFAASCSYVQGGYKKDLSLICLPERLDRSQQFVSRYEEGQKVLDLPELRKICHALGLTLIDFVIRLEA
jgi:hypothetical protein